jgi:hypothetical protein
MNIIKKAFRHIGILIGGETGTKKLPEVTPAPVKPSETNLSGEIHAAIAMAIYLYSSELHDQENPVITMIRTSKTYSPWSSKIYHLRRLPR